MSRVGGWLRSLLLWTGVSVAALLLVAVALLHPPMQLYYSPFTLQHPYAHLPTWGVQELYHNPITRAVLFQQHQDRVVDWAQPTALYQIGEKIATWLAVTLPAKVVPAPLHLVHLLQGPAQLQVLRSLVLLGVPDVLANRVLSLNDLHVAILANAEAQAPILRAGLMLDSADAPLPSFADLPLGKLERLMSFALSIGYFEEISYRGSHIYVHNAQSVILRKDHPNNLNHLLLHFSNEAYLAWHNLFQGLLAPEDDSSMELGVSGLSEDAELGGIYSTATSQQALQENKQRRQQAIANMRKSVEDETAAGTQQPKGKAVQTAWEATHKASLWNFFKARPALERNFAAAMGQIDASVNRALVADYSWDTLEVLSSAPLNASDSASSSAAAASAAVVRSTVVVPVESVVDLGGSVGSFLAAVLTAHPTIPRGVLFDLEGNIVEARKKLQQQGGSVSPFATLAADPSRSVELVAGDFFSPSTLPLPLSASSGTKYVLRQILHDWSDRDTIRILHNLRTRLRGFPHVALVLIESNRAEPEYSPTRSWVDFQMLVCCNAKERTPEQWAVLFAVTGWRITQNISTRSQFSVMEIQPDDDAASNAEAGAAGQDNTAAIRATLASQSAATAAQPKQEL